MEVVSIAIGIIILAVWMVAVPVLAGGILSGNVLRAFGLEGKRDRAVFRWCSGQIILWAGFQCLCVPMIIRERLFSEVTLLFVICSGTLALAGILMRWTDWKKRGRLRPVPTPQKRSAEEKILWGIFGATLLIQLVCAVLMAYEEGDDAFYIAISTITNSSDTMYTHLPYTGESAVLDVRHGLAPMPVWIAFLSRVTGLPTVSTAQVAVPVVLIVMSYAVFYVISAFLFGKEGEKRALFMAMTGMLILFSGYSIYPVENFLIVRTAQGKSIFGNIIMPYLFFLVMTLLRKIQRGEKTEWQLWMLFLAAVFAGCLCTTQGALLICIFGAVTGICSAVCCRKWKFLIPMGCCCLPALCYLLLYLKLK